MSTRYQTPPQIAEQLGIDEHKVLDWIKTCELVAVNVGNGKRQPRWRVSAEALDAFLAGRTSQPPTPKPPRTRHRRKSENFVEYF